MATGKLKIDEVLFAAEATRGNISEASRRLGVTRWALQKYLKRTRKAQEAFAEWREKLVDRAEQAIWDCVEERQPWAVALVLKTLGRSRGWVELSPAANAQGLQERGIVVYLPEKERIDLRWNDTEPVSAHARQAGQRGPESLSDDERVARIDALLDKARARQDESIVPTPIPEAETGQEDVTPDEEALLNTLMDKVRRLERGDDQE